MAIVTINQLADSNILSGNEVIPIFQDGCTVKTPVSSFQTSFGNNNCVTGVYSNIDGGKDNIVSGNFTSIQSGSANCVTGNLNIVTGKNNTSHGNSNTFINTENVSANNSSSFNTLIGVEYPLFNKLFGNDSSIILNNSQNNSVINTLFCSDIACNIFFHNAQNNNIIGGSGSLITDSFICDSENNFISTRGTPNFNFIENCNNVVFYNGGPSTANICNVDQSFIIGGENSDETIKGCDRSFQNIIQELPGVPFEPNRSTNNIIHLKRSTGGLTQCNKLLNVFSSLFLNNESNCLLSNCNLVYGMCHSSIIGTSNLRAGTTYNDIITADIGSAMYTTQRSNQTLILGGSGLNVTHGNPGGVLIGGLQNSLLSALPNLPTDNSRFSFNDLRLNNTIIGGEKNIIKGCNVCNSTIIASFSSRIDRDISPNVQTNSVIIGGNETTAVSSNMLHAERLYLGDLPTSDPGVPGVVWNNSGVLQIS